MSPVRVLIACGFLVVALAGSGCKSRLSYEDTLELSDAEERRLTVDGPSSDQKVKLDISATTPVDVRVYLSNDPKKYLVDKDQLKEESFELTIPSKNDFVILLRSGKKTTVSIKAKGQ